MICNCCAAPITAATISLEHVYILPVYAEIAPRQVVRFSTICRAVCRDCVAAIEQAHQQRRKRRNQEKSRMIGSQNGLREVRCA